MDTSPPPIWMNGRLIAADEATVPVSTHALHYGSGVFEGIRAYETPRGSGVFRLRKHMQRLIDSAAAYDMLLPYSLDELVCAVHETVAASGLGSAYVRPIAWRGAGKLGVDPSSAPVEVAILVMNWGAYLGPEAIAHGVAACMSPYRRFSNDMMPSHAKASGQYLNSILAKLDSKARGFQEAILLNEWGRVCEGTGENIFIVDRSERLVTPLLSESVLPGITRDTVQGMHEYMAHAFDDLNWLPQLEALVTVADLRAASEVFLTGTAAEITPVRSIEFAPGDVVDYGEPGPITKAMQDAFFSTVRGEGTPWAALLEYQL